MNAEEAAQKQHEIYERLAPHFEYATNASSSVPWEQVPENNKRLMIAVFEEILPLIRGANMQEIQRGNEERPTLQEVETLAHQLGVTYTGSNNGQWFDLDRTETPQLTGTYRTVQTGIDNAYGDLRRLQLTLQAITEGNQRNH